MYTVYWGNVVPFSSESFTKWVDAARFIKAMLDLGHGVNSVVKS